MSHDDVTSRLAFMGMDEKQRATLGMLQPLVKSQIGGALDHFYAMARATPETKAFFRDEAHMAKAKASQEAHWMRIASGRFDEDFYASVRRIGSVHARIGLDPRWYIGAYALALEKLIQGIGKRFSPLRRLLSLFRGPSAADASIAIVKAALLDMELSISIYFEVAETERNIAIAALEDALGHLAVNDLSTVLSGLPPTFATLERSFNESITALRNTIEVVGVSANAIRTGSTEIAQASEDLARRTEGNAASLEETSAALVQIDVRLKASATASGTTVARADQAISTVESGRAVAVEAVAAMGRVSVSAKGIDSVIEGVDKIAFQTRVLAMNAAVEAGRAGDAGRGFAVVADLVSALAMRAEEEAKRARDQLTVTQAEIICAVDAVHKVDGALANISGDVDAVHLLLGSMARDNAAQSQAVTEITAAIGSMDKATQQNAAMVEETSAAARSLTVEVSALAEQAAGFKFERRVVNIPVPVDHRHAPKLGAERPALKANYAEIRAPASAMPAPHIGATAATVGGQADWADF